MGTKAFKTLSTAMFAAAVISAGVYFCFGITASAADYDYTAKYDMNDISSGVIISSEGTYYITGSSDSCNVQVTANEGETVTLVLDGAEIKSSSTAPISLSGDGTVKIILIGDNTLTNEGTTTGSGNAGIYKGTSGYLVIEADADDSDASLTVTGGYSAAGIGGKYNSGASSNITINSGIIETNGGSNGAGIGGGRNGNGSNITITGGTVTATGGSSGAGIGGNRSGSDITISGGTVIATGGDNAAGIGGGSSSGTGSNITIENCTVTAAGGSGGAGIGGGYSSSGSNIKIDNSTVKATGGGSSSKGGAGIGGGYNNNGSDITITNSTVNAESGYGAAGIGGGCYGSSSSAYKGDGTGITITGSKVTVTHGDGYFMGAGIGGSYKGDGSDITITDSVIIATGSSSTSNPQQGAAIGGGKDGDGSNITITGSNVSAAYRLMGNGYNSSSDYNDIIIDTSSVIVGTMKANPVNPEGESLYLCTVTETSEGDKIYVDGEEYISSVVYHTTNEGYQYLYLPEDSKEAYVLYDIDVAKYYTLAYGTLNRQNRVIPTYVEDVIFLTKDGNILKLDKADNTDNSGITVAADGSGALSGIKIDTEVYGGEGVKYLDLVGISADGVFYQLENYYYTDETERYAFFPVSVEGSAKTSQRVRGAVGIKAEGADGTDVTYYVSNGTDGLMINAQ